MTARTVWFASWYGGPSYRAEGEREVFASISEAKRALTERRYAGWSETTYSDGRTEHAFTPGVTAESDLLLYAADSAAYDEPGWDYPSVRVFFGSRGAARSERVA